MKRLGPDDTAHAKRFLDVGDLLEDYAEDEAAGAVGACASTPRWLVKRLGPDDTARAKRFLDAGDLAACARLLLARYYASSTTGTSAGAATRCAPSPRTPSRPTPPPTPSS